MRVLVAGIRVLVAGMQALVAGILVAGMQAPAV
jgi:hypothetical protein